MLETAVDRRAALRPAGLGISVGAFALGALLALLGMLRKPPELDLRTAEALLAGVGVLLASVGLVGALTGRASTAAAGGGDVVDVPGRALVPGAAYGVGSALLLRFVVHLGLSGRLPKPQLVLGLAVPVLCLGMLWGGLSCLEAIGLLAAQPRAARVRRLGLAGLAILLYLPALGNFGLIDCWEPQYSEVAREMLTRQDWISLWWGDQNWFWSKPNLDFWLQGLSFTWFGLDPTPDAMIGAVSAGRSPAPEWAARLPNFFFALAGQLVLARGVARHYGPGAARFGSLILLTSPYWFLLTCQTMVDMTYVAPMAAALGFMLLAGSSGEERARMYRIGVGSRSLSLSGQHVLLGCISALALAQIFYLLSRHVSLSLGDGAGLHFGRDAVWAGSPGNCGLPGNVACTLDREATEAGLQPGVSAALWAACLAGLVWLQRGERRLKGLYYLAAWVCVALAVMGKAAPGLVLPLCTFGAWLMLRGDLGELREAKLGSLGLILACVAAPWFVQCYARHGDPFFERLFLHDMYERAFGHVHDTNSGVDTSFRYYVWQLGYGLFPWSGVAAVGALVCVRKSAAPDADPRFRSATALLMAWALACFGLFSIAGTKFHHYILPLVPAAAMLGGAFVDELWQRRRTLSLACLGLLAAVPTALVTMDLARGGSMPGAASLVQLFAYLYTRPWPETLDFHAPLIAFGAVAALACVALELPRARRWAVGLLGAAGASFAVWTLHVYMPAVAPHWGQRETISEYYRARKDSSELLVAYRQNWMGENFYTGNHVATFKTSGKPFENWIAARKRDGHRVLFFTTEHGTIDALKRELGPVAHFDLLTSRELNNKFVLARVEL